MLDNGEEWCKITYDKKVGYAMSKYLTIKNEATTISEMKERIEKL